MAIRTYNKAIKTQISDNFSSSEFNCHGNGCCSTTQIDDKLVQYLQQIRNHFGKAVRINSGYRCATHNARVGGSSKSNHMDGEAADIRVDGISPIEVARYAEYIGMLGIGVYGSFTHVDTRTSKYFWYDGGASNVKTFGNPTIYVDDLKPVEIEVREEEIDKNKFPYTVRITAILLNVRAGAGTKHPVKTQVKNGEIYTIVDEKDGWGKLARDMGWISLKYTEVHGVG